MIDGLSKRFILLNFDRYSYFFFLFYRFRVCHEFNYFVFSSYTELPIVFSGMEYLVAFFVKLVGFFSFCLFLGILVKRSAFALGFLWFGTL
jgi:hypothetical protein